MGFALTLSLWLKRMLDVTLQRWVFVPTTPARTSREAGGFSGPKGR